MATNITKEIMQRMLMEQAQQGQGGPMQEQQQGPQIDPQLDMIAKKMALLKGNPEDKYKIFIQLLPQLLQQFGGMQEEGGGQAMPPPQGSSEGRF
jgi:hypothetical protein